MAAGMSPEDIEGLLRELARRLSARGATASIRLVGGAALVARSYRTTATFDVDAVFHPEKLVLEVAAEMAAERNLPPDWLNSDAKAYIPFIDPTDWVELFRDGDVTVSTAPAKMLLAMKLKANRGRRDAEDIERLLAVCRIRSVDEAQQLYERYHAQEVLSDSVVVRIEAYLARQQPDSIT
jgi:hypothetical protein